MNESTRPCPLSVVATCQSMKKIHPLQEYCYENINIIFDVVWQWIITSIMFVTIYASCIFRIDALCSHVSPLPTCVDGLVWIEVWRHSRRDELLQVPRNFLVRLVVQKVVLRLVSAAEIQFCHVLMKGNGRIQEL